MKFGPVLVDATCQRVNVSTRQRENVGLTSRTHSKGFQFASSGLQGISFKKEENMRYTPLCWQETHRTQDVWSNVRPTIPGI